MLRSLFLFIGVCNVQRADKVRQRHVRDGKFVFQWLWKERQHKKYIIVVCDLQSHKYYQYPNFKFLNVKIY